MTPEQRLFGWRAAFDHPVTLWITVGIACALALAPLIVLALSSARHLPPEKRAKILTTWRSWLVLAPLIVVPVLLGAAWTIGATALLRRNILIYGFGGLIAPFIGIKLVDLVVHNVFGA